MNKPDGWLIEPDNTLVVVMAWPDFCIPFGTINWIMQRFSWENVRTAGTPNYVTARNATINMVLRESKKFTDFLFIDKDVTPTIESDKIFQIDADVVACDHPVANKAAWSTPESIHVAFWRVKRKVLEAIKPPWLMREYSADGCSMVGCDCLYLAKKVKEAGFTLAHGGWADHDIQASIPERCYC